MTLSLNVLFHYEFQVSLSIRRTTESTVHEHISIGKFTPLNPGLEVIDTSLAEPCDLVVYDALPMYFTNVFTVFEL